MKSEMMTKQSGEAVGDAVRGRKMRGARRATKMIAANVTADELSIIQEHAGRGGYESVAAYVRAVAVSPQAKYDTDSARIARPLVLLSDHIRRIRDLLDRSEADAVRGYLAEMQGIVHAALSSLRREHDGGVRK